MISPPNRSFAQRRDGRARSERHQKQETESCLRPRFAALARTRRESDMPSGLTFHISSSDCCISPKTPEAVMRSATSPMRVASALDPRCAAV